MNFSNNEQKKYPDPVGGLWIKENDKGKFFSMSIKIDGVEHTFFGYPNNFKKEGERTPDYRIYAPTKKAETNTGGKL